LARAWAAAAVIPLTLRGAMVMLPSTVLWGNRLKLWNTIPIR
jgi:hypothetical protein